MSRKFPIFDLARQWRLKRRAGRIAASPLFDARWYLDQNPDVREAGTDPSLHYLVSGAAEGRRPHPLFDPAWYLRQANHPELAGQSPLEHYLSCPASERCSPHPLFDPDWYRANNPEVVDAGIDVLEHFIRSGGREGRSPHPDFDAAWYLARYPDVASNGVNPLVHYINAGAREGRDPGPDFSTKGYLERNPDVAAVGVNPLVHYVVSGRREGRASGADLDFFGDARPGALAAAPEQLRSMAARARDSLPARLRQDPRPLLDEPNRTVVSWAAKSACTHVLIWHLDRLGLLGEAQVYSRWPHDYRVRIYYQSASYLHAAETLERTGPEQWTYVKVVRDPAKRCISSYRHALMNGYEDRLMSHHLGRDINHIRGFSYSDFLEYLERINLERCNVHHRLQRHPLDVVPFGEKYVINIDDQDLDTALLRINADQGLDIRQQKSERRAAIERAARRHAPEGGSQSFDPALWRKPLTNIDTENWPKTDLFRCDEASTWARQIYARDYAMIEWLSEQRDTVNQR